MSNPTPLPFNLPGERSAAVKREWIVPGLIGLGDLVAVYGPPGGGKSAFAADLSVAVASGREWFARSVTRGAVLYLAAERRDVTDRRIQAMGGSGLQIGIVGPSVDLFGDKDAVGKIAATVDALAAATGSACRLVVIDTLSRAAPSFDENSTRDAARLVDCLARITEQTGAALIFVTHESKASADLRGSSALLGAVDLAIRVTGKRTRTAEVVKANDSQTGERFVFDLCPTADGATVTVRPAGAVKAATAATLSPDTRRALEALRNLGGSADTEEWRSAFYATKPDATPDAKRRAFHDVWKRLCAAGMITETGSTVSVSEP